MRRYNCWLCRWKKQGAGCLVTCQGHILHQGCLPGGPAARIYGMFSPSVLSDVQSPLIFAFDRGWGFSFLYSMSLFALSLESEFCDGRKCSSTDQINVLVNFVPGQRRKCQSDLFQEQNSLCTSRKVFEAGGNSDPFLGAHSEATHCWGLTLVSGCLGFP